MRVSDWSPWDEDASSSESRRVSPASHPSRSPREKINALIMSSNHHRMRALIIFFATGIFSGYAPIARELQVGGRARRGMARVRAAVQVRQRCAACLRNRVAIACWISKESRRENLDNHERFRAL